MIKLTYTAEMQKQDELWETENEDIDKMFELYKEIIEEAISLGFNGIYQFSENCEAIVYIYDNQAEKDELDKNGNPVEFCFGYCKPLINCLEKYYLNN